MTQQAVCEKSLVRIIPPLTVTDSILSRINVAEDEFPIFNALTTYADADQVIAAHRVYKNNSGTDQVGSYPPDNPTIWADLGASNAWKMFDEFNNTRTENTGSISFDIRKGNIVNSIALLGLSGISVLVQMIDDTAGVVYERETALRSSAGVVGLYSWLYREHKVKETLVLTDLPAYRSAIVRVTIDAGSGLAGCSHVAMGRQETLGVLQYGFSVGIIDFSTINEADDGSISVKKGNYADDPEIDMIVEDSKFDYVKRTLTAYRGTRAVYVCGQFHETMTVFGLYRSFRVTVPHSGWAECTLTIRGLI